MAGSSPSGDGRFQLGLNLLDCLRPATLGWYDTCPRHHAESRMRTALTMAETASFPLSECQRESPFLVRTAVADFDVTDRRVPLPSS
jgi:hypothetical protein